MLATRHDADALDLLVAGEDGDAGAVARRATLFEPTPTVWAVRDTTLASVEPAALTSVDAAPIEPHIALALAVEGVVTNIEHGEITAEFNGLEVGRVTGSGDGQRFDVGVGAYDQGAFAVMNPGLTPDAAFAEVLAQVRVHRRRGAEPHPINRLVRERWLRAELCADPTSLGLDALAPVESVEPREGLHEQAPCFALSGDGTTVVACSVGIDLDLVPAAADIAAREGAERIVLVLPERDQHPLTSAVAARSVRPITIVTADEPWA